MEEAQAGQSQADFIGKYNIALKEARETLYWLRLLDASGELSNGSCNLLLKEADEIARVIASIIVRTKKGARGWRFLLLPFYFYQAPRAGITLVANSSMDRITCSWLRPPKLNMPTRLSGFAVSIIERPFLITVSGLPISDVPHSSIFFRVSPPGK